MSEKDVKDNETEALNNAAAETRKTRTSRRAKPIWPRRSNRSISRWCMTMEAIPSQPNRQKNAENTEGIATEDSVASDNANRVNETLALGATDDEQSLDQHETVQADSATSVSSQTTAKSNIIARRTHSSSRRTRHSRSTM